MESKINQAIENLKKAFLAELDEVSQKHRITIAENKRLKKIIASIAKYADELEALTKGHFCSGRDVFNRLRQLIQFSINENNSNHKR